MSMARVRERYSVPARRGGRVEYTGCGKQECGTITSARCDRLNIRLDGIKGAMPFHPLELSYLSADGKTVIRERSI